MTALSARDLSFVTPAGDVLLAPLDLELPRERHGLVGRNGAGKSLLARLLAGELAASSGQVVRHVPTRFLPQSPDPVRRTLGDLLDIAPKLESLARIEAGGVDPADFERIGDDWECASRWRHALAEAGLPDDLARPAAQLSGGELTRVRLLALFGHPSHYLILDEPSNHLDRHARAWLHQRLRAHPGGALVVSHDRELLDGVAAIHELSGQGLRHYGGNYALYHARRGEDQQAAERQLDQARRDLDTAQRDRQRTLQGQQKRQQRAGAGAANLPRLIIGKRQQQAEQSLGRLREKQARLVASSRGQWELARARVEPGAAQRIDIAAGPGRGGFAIRVDRLVLPWGNLPPLDFTLRMDERMCLDGRNGSGKSGLLRVLAGTLAPRAGKVQVNARRLLIDQHFSLIAPALSAVENLARLAPGHAAGHYRTLLAGIGLAGDRALSPAAVLSGGERVKLALLALDATVEPYELLLLDEPDNHLDLASRQLLENALRGYAGAIVLVSHDPVFVRRAGVEVTLGLSA